ncbi:MAG: class I tRNA ligase family protein, partial [Chloroflexi bacterium]|nr:class I tRNA ligase family protein [Chloroflexota bacterium]
GEKMSKVKGNVLNPIQTIEQYGTDALRFALTTGTAPGNDLRLSPAKLEASRNFANKLWNAARFVIRSIEPGLEDLELQRDSLPVEDRWILSRLNRTISAVTGLMDSYQFGEAQRQVHDFLWGEFCDWYIEMAKIRLGSSDKKAPSPVPVLVHVLEAALRLLHPFMPFITEELWQNLKRSLSADWDESIMIAPYPQSEESAFDSEADSVMEALIDIIRSIRNARAEYKVQSNLWVEAQIYAEKPAPAVVASSRIIETLARARPLTFLESHPVHKPDDNLLALVLKNAEVFIPLESMVDREAERKRLSGEVERCVTQIEQLEARLKDESFLSKAPAAVVEKERNKLATAMDTLERLRQQLAKFQDRED